MEPSNNKRTNNPDSGSAADQKSAQPKAQLTINVEYEKVEHDHIIKLHFPSDNDYDVVMNVVGKTDPSPTDTPVIKPPFDITALPNYSKNGKIRLFLSNGKYLTETEINVMERTILGRITKEVKDDLGKEYDTVRSHYRNIYPKLGVTNKAEAIVAYLKETGRVR